MLPKRIISQEFKCWIFCTSAFGLCCKNKAKRLNLEIKMDEKQREMSIDEAYAALEQEELAQAQRAYEALRKDLPKDPEVIALGVDILGSQQKDAEALELLEAGIRETNQNPILVAGHAGLLLDMYDDPDAAIADLEGLLERGCDDEIRMEALLMLGEALLRSQQPEKAVKAAEQALVLDPDEAQAHNLKAQACIDLHLFEQGLKASEQAIQAEEHFAPAYFSMGELREAMGDIAAADKAFALAREHDPDVYNLPVQMDKSALEEMLKELPADLSDRLESYFSDVDFAVSDTPVIADLAACEPKLSPSVIMRFIGSAAATEGDPWQRKPERVEVYRRNLLRACADEDDVAETLAGVLVDEVKAFIGVDEDEVWEGAEDSE